MVKPSLNMNVIDKNNLPIDMAKLNLNFTDSSDLDIKKADAKVKTNSKVPSDPEETNLIDKCMACSPISWKAV